MVLAETGPRAGGSIRYVRYHGYWIDPRHAAGSCAVEQSVVACAGYGHLCGRRSSAASRRRSARSYSVCTAFPAAVRLRAAALLASSRIAWTKTNRMAKRMAKRRVKSGMVITRGVSTKEAPAKAGAKVSGIQMMHCEPE